jgi:hypothetical protein
MTSGVDSAMEDGAALTWGWTTTTTNFHATLGNEERIMTTTSTAARNEIDLALDGLLDELFGDDGSSLVETKLMPSEQQSDEVVSAGKMGDTHNRKFKGKFWQADFWEFASKVPFN